MLYSLWCISYCSVFLNFVKKPLVQSIFKVNWLTDFAKYSMIDFLILMKMAFDLIKDNCVGRIWPCGSKNHVGMAWKPSCLDQLILVLKRVPWKIDASDPNAINNLLLSYSLTLESIVTYMSNNPTYVPKIRFNLTLSTEYCYTVTTFV